MNTFKRGEVEKEYHFFKLLKKTIIKKWITYEELTN